MAFPDVTAMAVATGRLAMAELHARKTFIAGVGGPFERANFLGCTGGSSAKRTLQARDQGTTARRGYAEVAKRRFTFF